MEKQQKPISPPVASFYCSKCGEQLRPSIYKIHFDIMSGTRNAEFIWKCPASNIFNKIMSFVFQGHTKIITAEDGTRWHY